MRKLEQAVFIRVKDSYQRIDYKDITYLEASGSYTNIYFVSNAKMIVAYPLSTVLGKFVDSSLIRVHRSFAINLNYLDGFMGNILKVRDGKIPLSRQYYGELFEQLNVLGSV